MFINFLNGNPRRSFLKKSLNLDANYATIVTLIIHIIDNILVNHGFRFPLISIRNYFSSV